MLARIAQVLDVSLDHLVFDDIARRPLHANQDVLGDRLNAIAELDSEALAALTNIIDALITKSRLRAITGGNES